MTNEAPAIVWFRDDLRIADQPALRAAHETGAPLLCIYIFDEESAGLRPHGGASRWWLHHSLAALEKRLEAIGGRLHLLRGAAADLLPNLVEAAGANRVFWTRRYAPAETRLDTQIKADLKDRGVEVESFNGQLLFEPWRIKTKADDFFKVYTPFWRAAMQLPQPDAPHGAPRSLKSARWPAKAPARQALEDLGLLPKGVDWTSGLQQEWTPGETGAHERLRTFLDSGLSDYGEGRDYPGRPVMSHLSPHLRFGELSPAQVFHAVGGLAHSGDGKRRDVDKFLSELGWREFNYNLLFNAPDLATRNFQPRFDDFPWERPKKAMLKAWQTGRTGYPIVDAGMRELWQTGYMHNRVRMIAASFLIKHLLVDWRIGEQWFWDTLCDADPANNPSNWQWVAGSGADAAPYFRIFNPTVQGEKFDPDGDYVRKYIPELAKLPSKWIHKPWTASPQTLGEAGVVLDKDYPQPIVDHQRARKRALEALASLPGR